MKVLLIQSPLGKNGKVLSAFPLGLAYLSGGLSDHELTVLDPNMEEYPFEKIKETVERTNPDVIGLSLRNIDTAISSDSHSFLYIFEALIKLVHQYRSNAKIIVGGTGFSMFPQEVMERFPEIDYGLFLEGEHSFPALLRNLNKPELVKGIYFRRNGQVHFTGKSDFVDFDELSAPPRELEGLNFDLYKKIPHSVGVQTKRGCAFRCAYCTYPYLQGSACRMRSPKKIVDEVENLVNQHGVESVFFADTIFNYPFDHARKIVAELNKRKLPVKWAAWFKENFVNKQFLIEAQKSGCVGFEFSPDGASESALNTLQKDATVQDIKKTAELISELEEVKVNYNFLWNTPGESLRDVASFHKLLAWLMIKNRKQISFVGLNSMRIYPHTVIHTMALKQGYISSSQDLLNPTFYEPFPLKLAYFPARSANYIYLKSGLHSHLTLNPLKIIRSFISGY